MTNDTSLQAPAFVPGACGLPWYRRAFAQGAGYILPSCVFALIPIAYALDAGPAVIALVAENIGHVKSVGQMTGVDTDRLKEEKARGITVDLGFAYQPLADGSVLGFVDVPGHEKLPFSLKVLLENLLRTEDGANITRGDIDSLVDFRAKAPAARLAHPTADHFVPLLLTLGAADDPSSAVSVIDRTVLGNSIRSIQAA